MRHIHHNKLRAENLNLPLRRGVSTHRALFATPLPPLTRSACTPSSLPRIIINTKNHIAAHMPTPTLKTELASKQNRSTALTKCAQPVAQPDAHQRCWWVPSANFHVMFQREPLCR